LFINRKSAPSFQPDFPATLIHFIKNQGSGFQGETGLFCHLENILPGQVTPPIFWTAPLVSGRQLSGAGGTNQPDS